MKEKPILFKPELVKRDGQPVPDSVVKGQSFVFIGQGKTQLLASPWPFARHGQSGTLTLTLLSNDTINNDTIPIQVSQIAAGQAIDWSAQQASLQPSTIPAAAWNVIFGNLVTTLGPLKTRGAPVDYIVPEPMFVLPVYQVVMKDAPHPFAAALAYAWFVLGWRLPG